MANIYFEFKEFIIYQDKCAMKVGTDGVLLGAWTDAGNAESILDIGTGTGLLALMLAQRNKKARITGIEIESDAALQATGNTEKSRWGNRITIINIGFQDFIKQFPDKFDLIVCNPPYFVNSKKAPDEKRTVARHNDSLPVGSLVYGVSKCLSETGKFSVIIPSGLDREIIEEAYIRHLYCAKILNIRPTRKLPVKRKMLEFRKEKTTCFESELMIQNEMRNGYSSEYINLTRNFYLNF